MFVLRELKRSLTASMDHWDPDNYTNRLAVVRMDGLIELVVQMNEKTHLHVDWVAISSFLFGTCMVHKVINDQAREEFKFGQNPWFGSFLYNFGETCDRIKLYAILEDNG